MNAARGVVVAAALSLCSLLPGCGRRADTPYTADQKLRDAVFRAMVENDFPEVRRLITAHPELMNVMDNGGVSLVFYAMGNDDDLSWWMLKNGARPDAVVPWDNSTVLHYAAGLGSADMVNWLLKEGADPNRRNARGDTPLGVAATAGDMAKVKVLAGRNPSDEDLDRAILNGLLSLPSLRACSYKTEPVEAGGLPQRVKVDEATARAAHDAARRRSEEVVSFLCARRRDPGAPFAFWKAAEGAGADRMNLRKGADYTRTVYSTLWKRDDAECLVRIRCCGEGLLYTPYDVVVIDRTPRVVLQGQMLLRYDDFPYALVEVYSESGKHPEALRGKWTLGVAHLRWNGDWKTCDAALEAMKPRVLTGWRRHEDDPANTVTAQLIEWDDGPARRYDAETLAGLDDVKFRWAEPGPSIFTEMPDRLK